jgi:hypothetical protein
MDDDCTLHGDRKVFLYGENSVDVLWTYIESGKTSRGEHKKSVS